MIQNTLMKKNNGEISDNVLKAIEEMWEFSLPKDYRNFILHYNGGTPQNKMFKFKKLEGGSCLTLFFGLIKDFNNNILLKQKYSGERVPENCMPISRDVYGNLILLSVKGSDRGKIYFWDHEREADEGEIPNYSNLTLIADSFEEFINGLYSDENYQ